MRRHNRLRDTGFERRGVAFGRACRDGFEAGADDAEFDVGGVWIDHRVADGVYYFCRAKGVEDFELGVDDEGEMSWEVGGHVCGGIMDQWLRVLC